MTDKKLEKVSVHTAENFQSAAAQKVLTRWRYLSTDNQKYSQLISIKFRKDNL
jgi:hypothetical protein